MSPQPGRPGLTTRVTLAFGAISLVVALVLSGATYLFARVYLVEQRESVALNRALVDARVVDVALVDKQNPNRALGGVPTSSDSQVALNVNGEWFSTNVTVPPSDIPSSLLEEGGDQGAWQRFSGDSATFLAIAVPVTGGTFVELFSFAELDKTLNTLAWVLAAASLGALIVGGAIGHSVGLRLLAPLSDLAVGARRITAGDLGARVEVGKDPDLAAISTAFNEMADAVEDRIERERRFSGNVSHELRSPLTGIQGTAALLQARSQDLPEREVRLIEALGRQVSRFSQTVLDLLDISRIGGDETVQHEVIDVSALVDDVLRSKGLPPELRHGPVLLEATDPRRLERIVSNLVENAERHGRGLSAVTVERSAQTARLMFDDAGPGVSSELAAQIFEPFHRGDSTASEGAGLGLAIVREQIRLLGGEVSVEESPQQGARFIVTLLRGQP